MPKGVIWALSERKFKDGTVRGLWNHINSSSGNDPADSVRTGPSKHVEEEKTGRMRLRM